LLGLETEKKRLEQLVERLLLPAAHPCARQTARLVPDPSQGLPVRVGDGGVAPPDTVEVRPLLVA
jgi:hypothetical protein